MAKIYKIQGYIIDIHEEFSDEEFKCIISNYSDYIMRYFKSESADIGKWYDEHPLNYRNSDISVCEKYFEEG